VDFHTLQVLLLSCCNRLCLSCVSRFCRQIQNCRLTYLLFRHCVKVFLLTYLICVIKNGVCYCSVSKTSVTHSSVVLRALLSLAILQRDTELAAEVLPSSVHLARDNTELAWLAAFCHLLQVQCRTCVTECIHFALVFLLSKMT